MNGNVGHFLSLQNRCFSDDLITTDKTAGLWCRASGDASATATGGPFAG